MTTKTKTGAKQRASKPSQRRPDRRTAPVNEDCCLLCGVPTEGSYRSDLGHFRRSHPGYARGLLLRMAAPFVFIVSLAILATFGAPQVTFIAALAVCTAIFAAGIVLTRRERRVITAGRSSNLVRLVREGGWRFLVIPVAIVALILFGRK